MSLDINTSASWQLLSNIFPLKSLAASTAQEQSAVLCALFEQCIVEGATRELNGADPSTPFAGCSLHYFSSTALTCLADEEFSTLAKAAAIVSSESVTLFPEFGCALLALQPKDDAGIDMQLLPGHMSLHLVGLDGWLFDMHSTASSTFHTSWCTSSTTLCCGTVPAGSLSSLVTTTLRMIEERKDERAREIKKGFQRTPAFILAVITDALQQLQGLGTGSNSSSLSMPRGGFTDVGLHTGGTPKATSWPLVQQALLAVLELAGICTSGQEPQLLLHLAMAHFELWLLQQVLQGLTAEKATAPKLTDVMIMLESASKKAASLAMAGHDMTAYEAACQAASRAALLAEQYTLPADIGSSWGHYSLPTGVLPAKLAPEGQDMGLAAAKHAAAAALGSLPLACATVDLGSLPQQLHQLQQQSAALSAKAAISDTADLLQLSSTEYVLFSYAVAGFQQPGCILASAPEVQLLEQVLDRYRSTLYSFRCTAAAAALWQKELRSLELLVVWVGYCLMFESAKRQFSHMEQYGVALQWTDLQYAVLPKKLAVDAGRSVAAYLVQHTMPSKQVFSLTESGRATFSFAYQHAAQCSHLTGILKYEKQQAQQRIDKRWAEVQRKQMLAVQLRVTADGLMEDIAALQPSMAQLEVRQQHVSSQLSDVEARLYYYTYHGRRQGRSVRHKRDNAGLQQQEAQLLAKQQEVKNQLRPLEQQKQALQDQLWKTNQQLKEAEQAPTAIIQPLPSDRCCALQWLFFLHMPGLLRCLSRCSFLAQQLLLPLPADAHTVTAEVHGAITVSGLSTSLVSHHTKYQDSIYHKPPHAYSGSDGCLKLYSAVSAPTLSSIGPSHVDSITTPQTGVWYPDSLTPSMAWSGVGTPADGLGVPSGFYNPFAFVQKHLVAASFTEQLPSAHSSLQWAMLLENRAATLADRGNLGIARQHERPDWLPKPAYLILTSLRSYPLLQWQRLCTALKEGTLPLGHPAVLCMVMQAVHQVGELTHRNSSGNSRCSYGSTGSAGQVQLLWRSDWDQAGGALDAMGYELQQLADKLAEAPREHDAVLLLGQLAAYLADWSPNCRSAAACFAAMTSKAADQMQLQVEQAAQQQQDSVVAQLQAKQCKARALSLLCYGAGPLDAAAVEHMLKLIVLVKHGDVCLAGASAGKHFKTLVAELQELHVQCRQVMARQLPAILAIQQQQQPKSLNQLLTAAVSTVLQRAPQQLHWEQLTSSSSGAAMSLASFQAEGSDGHLYSLNILDGTVLLDGAPPGRLSSDILQHPMYKRTFGSSNFEIAVARTAERTTLRPVNSCFYNFYWTTAGSSQRQLVIEEMEKGSGVRLQLLDVEQDGGCGLWGNELPVRLRELHSHWYSRDDAVILLRPKDFKLHRVHFIISCAPPLRSTSVLNCWRVPHHLTSTPWQQLLQQTQHVQQLKAAQLVLLQQTQPVLHILSKFEDPRFIHAYIPSSAACRSTDNAPLDKQLSEKCSLAITAQHNWQLQFELPRFRLEFELQHNGHLVSRDHGGFRLSFCQQLSWRPDTLEIARLSNSSGSCGSCKSSCSTQANLQSPAHASSSMSVALESGGSSGSGNGTGSKDGTSEPAVLQSSSSSEKDAKLLFALPDFSQYLVLESIKSGASNGAEPVKLALVPAGCVKLDSAGRLTVEVHRAAGAVIAAHKYSIHPRFSHLRASSVSARLQLAALYAASSSLLPEPSSQMTGAQLAMQSIRQSWVNTPLAEADMQNLRAAAALAGHLAPALRLLTCELEASTCQSHHLHAATGDAATVPAAAQARPEACRASSDALSEYMIKAAHILPGGWTMHPSLRLHSEEEARLIGVSSLAKAASVMPAWKKLHGQYIPTVVPACPVPSGFFAECDEKLQALVLTAHPGSSRSDTTCRISSNCSSSSSRVAPYPLKPGVGGVCTSLEQMQHEDLKKSWIAHHSMQMPDKVDANCKEAIQTMQVEVIAKRKLTQDHLMRHLTYIPPNTGAPGTSFRLLKHSGAVAVPSLLDLLPCAWQPELLLQYNPFLSSASVHRLHEAVLVWLQLCVLEDKLGRLVQLISVGPEATSTLIQELLVHRTWDVAQHPKWLVFEVEGQLQIRPAQYDIAQHLMANPGAIMQLNMGEGKTRVILPMLALHWATHKKWVVRLNFLSTLLPEAYEHLHQHLTASVLGVKLMLMPFHRDVSLTQESARSMRAAVSHCQRVGGLLLVVPEHRMSLELKWYELRLKGDKESLAVCHELAALAAVPYLDILDESDELLHHRFQLVYACGDRQPLFARPERVAAIQALLHALTQLADNPDESACPELHTRGLAVWPAVAERPSGSFCGVQLLSGGPLESVLPGLHERLAAALLANPPYEMRWINSFAHQDAVLHFVTDAAASFDQLQASASGLTPDQADQLLTLRGLLACNMLQHCLLKRHNVDFGINRSETARKRLAVPYRAAHTPSDRSEFAQPDVALLLTHISYYSDGLSVEQFKQAVDQLLFMGENAKQAYYKSWLALLPANRIVQGDLAKFDAVDKVDPTNPQQLSLMWQHMRHNMAVVDLWLSYCLLPNETSQFPERLTRNAWHLADNAAGQVVGFSGTNDNHRLLPLQVHQADASVKPHLAATNGRMLAMLLQQASYCTLERQEKAKGGKPVWQVVLGYALKHKLHALLDCGALLAGTTNRDAAVYVLQHMDSEPKGSYQGVCYFDTDFKQWIICDRLGRSLARQASPVAERDTFVIFDEARCRGADLKLQQQAVGLLTLAPGMCKDKLMQAAGRMRQLGRGQTLHVVGLPDVTEKIIASNTAPTSSSSNSKRKVSSGPGGVVRHLLVRVANSSLDISMQHVLQWVMSNTVQATLHGVTQWASQGLYFAVSKGNPDRALQHDELWPKDMYGGSKAPRPLAEVVCSMIQQQFKALQTDAAAPTPADTKSSDSSIVDPKLQALVSNATASRDSSSSSASTAHPVALVKLIEANASRYGEGHMVVAGAGVNEECERELEQEEEQEEEQEVQVPRVDAAAEQDWDYAEAFKAVRPDMLPAAAGVSRLIDAVQLLQPDSIRSIGWSRSVYVTSNFMLTTAPAARAAAVGGLAGALGRKICLSDYLRLVDSMVAFHGGEVLLLSEREADAIVELLWRTCTAAGCRRPASSFATARPLMKAATAAAQNLLLSLPYIRLARSRVAQSTLANTPATANFEEFLGQLESHMFLAPVLSHSGSGMANARMMLSSWLHNEQLLHELVSVHLFNGGAMFDGDRQQLQHLHSMVHGRREAAEALLDVRGRQAQFPRSELELACDPAKRPAAGALLPADKRTRI